MASLPIAVLGLWHLGSVTAACAAAAGHDVHAWDPDGDVLRRFGEGQPAVDEPGLAALVAQQLAGGRLRAATTLRDAVQCADVVWIAFDTPVDADDHGDVEVVVAHVSEALGWVREDALILASSQWPAGTTRRLEAVAAQVRPGSRIHFACAPENLRLGKALDVFMHPDRVVIGVRHAEDRPRLEALFAPLSTRIEWMGVESAEMTKHAVNAFLATSIVFINEVATLCERVGADAREVERGLRSETRIGPYARVSPGAAFAGGTLARDVQYLRGLGQSTAAATTLFDSVLVSNRAHRSWSEQRLRTELGSLEKRRIAVWGLTYKPGTSTLRRSTALELIERLLAAGTEVHAHDPGAEEVPAPLGPRFARHDDALAAAAGAHALVVATEWPDYRRIPADALAAQMPRALIIDANAFLGPVLGGDPRFRLVSVGQP